MVIAVGPPCKASGAEREGEGIAGGSILLQGTVICGLKATPQAALSQSKPSDCISSPRRNTAGAPEHTAQLSPQTCHASHISHISHIRGHHHMQSDCMCLVFKREPAEGLKSMLCEVQSLWLKLVACCDHCCWGNASLDADTPTCTAEHHQPPTPIIYISRSGHGGDGLRWAAMAAIHVLARMRGLVIEAASTQHELLSTHLSPSEIAIRNRRQILLSQNRTRCFLFLRSISTKSICTWFSLIGCCIYRWRNDFLDRQVLAAKSRDRNHNHTKLNRCTWL